MNKKATDKNKSDSIKDIDRNINIGLFIAVLMSACIAVYSSINTLRISGPSAIAADYNGVIVALYDRFIRLSKDGLLVREVTKENLGISVMVKDIQLLSNGDLIVGDGGNSSLFKCDSELISCVSLSSNYDVGHHHKFYVDEANQSIVLSNTERNELVLLNMDGSLDKVLIPRSAMLEFPDGIALIEGDEALLTNALKKQLLKIKISSDGAEIVKGYEVNNSYAVNGQILPMAIARVNNIDWWVAAQANSVIEAASVLRFDESLVPQGRLLFDGLVYPVDIQDMGNFVLVADQRAHRLFAFNYDGSGGRIFGDNEFNKILDTQVVHKEISELVRWISLGLLVISLGLALFIENVRKKEKAQAAELEKLRQPNDFLKITTPETMVRIFRIFPIIFVAMMLASGFLLYGAMPELVMVMASIETLLCFTMFLTMSMMINRMPKLIEVESGIISFTTQKDEVISDAINNISYADSMVLIKDEYFLLGNKGVLLKDQDGYNKLMSFFNGSEKLGTWQVQKLVFIKDKVTYLALFVVLLLMIFLMAYTVSSDDIVKEKDLLVDVVSS